MADDWDQYAPVSEQPSNQAPTNWDQYQPAQEPTNEAAGWDRYAKVDEHNDPRNPYGQSTQPSTTSLGVAAREFGRSVLPGVAGVAAGALVGGAASPFVTPVGGALAGIGTGMVVGGATRKVQDEVLDTLGLDSPESRARDVAEHPTAATAGALASAAVTFQPGQIGTKVAQRLGSAAILGGINVAQQGVEKGISGIDPTEAALAAGTGFVLPKPRGYIEGAGALGGRLVGREAPQAGASVGIDPTLKAATDALKPPEAAPAPAPAPPEPVVNEGFNIPPGGVDLGGAAPAEPIGPPERPTVRAPVETSLPPEEVARRAELEAAPAPPMVSAAGREFAPQAKNIRPVEEPVSENFGGQGVGGQNKNEIPEATPATEQEITELRKPAPLGAAAAPAPAQAPPAAQRLSTISNIRGALSKFANGFKEAFTPEVLTPEAGEFRRDVLEGQGTTDRFRLQQIKKGEELERAINSAPANDRNQFIQTFQAGVPKTNSLAPLADAAMRTHNDYINKIQPYDPDGNLQRFWLSRLFADPGKAAGFADDWKNSGRKNIPTIGDFIADGNQLNNNYLLKKDGSVNPVKVMQDLHNVYDAFLKRQKIVDLSLNRGGGPIYENQGAGLVPLESLSKGGKPLYATPEVATMWKRYFGPDSMDPSSEKFWDTAQRVKNATTSWQLLGGLYHLFAETHEALTGDVMRSISQAAAGNIAKAGKLFGQAPAAPIRQAKFSAQKALEAYYEPQKASKQVNDAVDMLVKAGWTPERIQRYTPEFNITRGFWQSWQKAALQMEMGELGAQAKTGPVGAGKSAFELVGKAMSDIMHPLFNVYIPRLKAGAALEQMVEYMAANANHPERFQKMADHINKSIDDRLGEMNQSHLFWNRTLKRIANLLMISPGWEAGTIRAAIGGTKDLLASKGKALSITSPDFKPNAAWPFAFAITTAAIGTMYEYLKTGKMPEDVADPFFPKTGGLTKSGTPERAILPGYLKDIHNWWHALLGNDTLTQSAANQFYDKLAMVPRTVWDVLAKNKDWSGHQIANPSDPLQKRMQQYLSYVQANMVPITGKQLTGPEPNPRTAITTPEKAFGIRHAPKDVEQPAAYARASTKANNRAAEEARRFHAKGYFGGGIVGDGRADPKSMPAQSAGTTSFDEGGPVDPGFQARQNTGSDASKQLAGDNSLTGINSEIAPTLTQHANWPKFESEARPSQNVVDERKRGFMRLIPSIGNVSAQTGGLSD